MKDLDVSSRFKTLETHESVALIHFDIYLSKVRNLWDEFVRGEDIKGLFYEFFLTPSCDLGLFSRAGVLLKVWRSGTFPVCVALDVDGIVRRVLFDGPCVTSEDTEKFLSSMFMSLNARVWFPELNFNQRFYFFTADGTRVRRVVSRYNEHWKDTRNDR